MNIYIPILKKFLSFDFYRRFYDRLDLRSIEAESPDIFRLFKCLPSLHASADEKTYTPLDFELVVLTEYPKYDRSILTAQLNLLSEDQTDPAAVEGYVRSLATRHAALAVAHTALEVADGRKELSAVHEILSTADTSEKTDEFTSFVSDDLDFLLEQTTEIPGLRWRLGTMNRHLGSLRKGDFGIMFARPETGKTTFLASEVSFFAGQLDETAGPILWINNEEVGNKVMIRCYQAVFGKTIEEILEEKKNYHSVTLREQFVEETHGKIKIVEAKPSTKKFCEQLCRQYNPSMIIFDQIDKVVGFDADRPDLELKDIYSWARNLAAQYGPVIGVCQAGGTGDGKQWLTMNDIDGSKTAKQGEADWILGIGKTYDFGKEQIRYFNLSKNKLFGDADTDHSMRHGKWSVFIKPEVARYVDFNNDGTINN